MLEIGASDLIIVDRAREEIERDVIHQASGLMCHERYRLHYSNASLAILCLFIYLNFFSIEMSYCSCRLSEDDIIAI
jgi:hypothetical protein